VWRGGCWIDCLVRYADWAGRIVAEHAQRQADESGIAGRPASRLPALSRVWCLCCGAGFIGDLWIMA